MRAKEKLTRAGFVKSYLLPALFTFLIPGFGLWFFHHVEKSYDRDIGETVLTQIRVDNSLTEEKRQQAIGFFRSNPVSKILASNQPEVKRVQGAFEEVKTRYAIFRWMKRISLVCLVAGAGALIACGLGVLLAPRSQNTLYWSLRIGWNILRWFALVEVIGQGILAVALSFWVTAFWMGQYIPKLILIIAVLALCAAALLIKAIFRKLPKFTRFEGRLLAPEAAPLLWERVREMAQRLGIAPPDNIFVGIDDNFFVTEHPVEVGKQQYTGRTLFVSLSLLKTLSRGEADSVLAHELAHFSGEDTLYSNRISPLLGKYAHYLEALYQGGISRPIFYFMFCFWNGYQASLGKLSREREFRADRIGAELTSPRDTAHALVKIAAYCRYRGKVQSELFGKNDHKQEMNVFDRIEKGYPEFVTSCVSGTELADADTPHPFDSHPPLAQRLQQTGFDLGSVLQSESIHSDVSNSWYFGIQDAAVIEAEQWKAFEEQFQKVHQETLAWRFKPEGENEIQHVEKYFPQLQFTGKKGATATLDYEKLSFSEWDSPLYFSTIVSCRLDEGIGGHKLVIECKDENQEKQKRKIPHKDLLKEGVQFLQVFQNYYGRHLTSVKYHEELATSQKESV